MGNICNIFQPRVSPLSVSDFEITLDELKKATSPGSRRIKLICLSSGKRIRNGTLGCDWCVSAAPSVFSTPESLDNKKAELHFKKVMLSFDIRMNDCVLVY